MSFRGFQQPLPLWETKWQISWQKKEAKGSNSCHLSFTKNSKSFLQQKESQLPPQNWRTETIWRCLSSAGTLLSDYHLSTGTGHLKRMASRPKLNATVKKWTKHIFCHPAHFQIQIQQIFIISREKFICGARNNYQIKQNCILHIHDIMINKSNNVNNYQIKHNCIYHIHDIMIKQSNNAHKCFEKYSQTRQQIWLTSVSLKIKLGGSAADLCLTTRYVELMGKRIQPMQPSHQTQKKSNINVFATQDRWMDNGSWLAGQTWLITWIGMLPMDKKKKVKKKYIYI